MNGEEFRTVFQTLFGYPPLSWQERLYREHFAPDAQPNIPHVIDLPTGLGKTMVMAIWLIAWAWNKKLPRRLVYVVDRRTVVDQATDLAQRLVARPITEWMHEKFDGKPPVISTLRGQLADNREWSRDPSRRAIIIGTVDLIGSALLFSGYRSSFKQRPLEAGLLGQDSLLVLDEAHLSKPFEKLLGDIGREGRFQRDRDGELCGKPMKVIRMSATSTTDAEDKPFRLEGDFETRTGDFRDDTIYSRYKASKRLSIQPAVEKSKLNQAMADAAIELAKDRSRVVVFVRSPGDAIDIAKNIREHEVKTADTTGKKPKVISTTPFAAGVEVLTGTMRGLERDALVEKPVLRRFLDGNEKPEDRASKESAILVSTSAGEVGFDLNADHMVCDATTIDSMIQRLGRVNRRGYGDALVLLFVQKDAKADKPLEKAIAKTLELLEGVSDVDGFKDVSPKNIAALKASDKWKTKDEHDKTQYEYACSPEPTMVELTDILLDSWSMTSIIEPMPGRPDVGPWLRGIEEEQWETTITWRAELDLKGFDELDLETIEEWFDTHRILTHETLSVPTGVAAKWFVDRWNAIGESRRESLGGRSAVIDRAGLRQVTLESLVEGLQRKPPNYDSIRNASLIVPASFGGIKRGEGLLRADFPQLPNPANYGEEAGYQDALKVAQEEPDVADEPRDGQIERRRETIGDDLEHPEPLCGEAITSSFRSARAKFVLELSADDDNRLLLASYVPKREKLDWGTTKQYLHDHEGERGHVELVREHADGIITRLGLSPDDPVRKALEFAADGHDEGKDRERWQRCAGREPDEMALGKSAGRMRRDSRGYRHEFGSLREFIDSHEGKIDQEVFDLAMHLIATHHGRGRPHFPKGGFDPDAESRSPDIHTAVIGRFARLQRKFGYWRLAWLENLLRCADALASAADGGQR